MEKNWRVNTLGEFPGGPAGLWAVADSKTGRGMLHFFDPAYASPFFYKDQSSPSLTMELFAKSRTLGFWESHVQRTQRLQDFIPEKTICQISTQGRQLIYGQTVRQDLASHKNR